MTTNNVQLDSFLDATLDDVADLPSFKSFPAGAYVVKCTLATKEIAGHPAIEAKFEHVETKEQAEGEAAEAVNPGDVTTVSYFLDNDFGPGSFKRDFNGLRNAMGFVSNRDLVEGVKGTECLVVFKQTKPNAKGAVYNNVHELYSL